MTRPFSFLDLPSTSWVASNPLAFAVRDRFPVSNGHTLLVPRRLIATWFEATREEQVAILDLMDEVKAAVDAELRPDGYNVGFNAGVAAGQTVLHLHVHVIPRYHGDSVDPRGGVRGVIVEKQKYDFSALAGQRSFSREARAVYRYAAPPPNDPIASYPTFSQLPAFVHGDDAHFEHTVREALISADRADILSAFVQTSGVLLLIEDLRDALQRGTQIRLLTGDYLGITSADALRMLLRLSEEHPQFTVFFFETTGNTPFHPKSYIFSCGGRGVAYVGSSNLSRSALQYGVEWNLRLVSSDDERTFTAIRKRFDHLLAVPGTRILTRAVIDAYEARAPVPIRPGPEPRTEGPAPNEIQVEALEALSNTRQQGHTKGLVVLATGLGKTYLAAFDFKAMRGERALFVAHREEILEQAKDNWQAVFPDKVVGTYDGSVDPEADLVFASVQMLSRWHHLSRFTPQYFDYIVMDEFHHAAAHTYRRVLAHFQPRFLLGLTATPDRMDGRSLLELCDDNLVYRRDLIHGIARRLLIPFHYFGIRDMTDYAPIPWRGGRFDVVELTNAVATQERAQHALREYRRLAVGVGRRTLCFCCTIEHADFMRDYFERNGIKAASVHSGPTSDPRGKSLRDLKSGDLEVLCAVDVFNEGLDVPDIDTILMLRPTESPVVFLQQLGRGLRRAEGKARLTVIDFIGNHRSFLTKPQSLVFLLGDDLPPLVALKKIQEQALDLPEGCRIHIDVEAIELLRSLVQTNEDDIAVFEYMEFRDAHGRRPTALELFHAGVNFAQIRKNKSTWFHFVRDQGDLTEDESAVLAHHEAWFGDLLRTKMTKAYKMLALRALLDGDALFTGMDVESNALGAFESVRTDLLLFRELREDPDRASIATSASQWREMPLKIWTRGEPTSRPWFKFESDRFVPTFTVAPEQKPTFEEMTEELVDLRLQQHRDKLIRGRPLDATEAPIILTVSHANSRPILRFDRARRTDIPIGSTLVEVDGERYVFDFKKIAVNVVTREGSKSNVLAALMRKWLGPTAGLPGTRHHVKLLRDSEDRWRLERNEVVVAPLASVAPGAPQLTFYPDVRAACGALQPAAAGEQPAQQLRVNTARTVNATKHFVVRATGNSMNGGAKPIADGDLVLCEWAPDARPEDIEGRAYLLVGSGPAEESFLAIKVPRRTNGTNKWILESWNPDEAPHTLPAGVKLEPVARVLEVVTEPMGLVLWGEYNRDSIAETFGHANDPSWKVGHRDITVDGVPHTILMITLRKAGQTKVEHRYADQFLSPTRLQWESQASTKAADLKGRRITGHGAERRTIHLFVQYDSHSPFAYCGPLNYESHESEAPMRVRFILHHALPDPLWKLWSR